MSWEDEARRYAQNADYWRERAEKAEKLLRMWNEVYAKAPALSPAVQKRLAPAYAGASPGHPKCVVLTCEPGEQPFSCGKSGRDFKR